MTTRPQPAAVETRLGAAEKELTKLKKQLADLQKPTSEARLNARVGEFSRTLREVQADTTSLREAILEDPAKAVELPLLKKDIEASKADNKAAIEAVQQDVERQYDLMKFVVGTFAFGFLALVVQAVASWRGNKPA